MTRDLLALVGDAREYLLVFLVVFLRVGAAMSLLPAFGEQNIPQRVRLVLGLGFTLIVTPAVYGTVQPLLAAGAVPRMLYLTEPIVGLAFGMSIRLFVIVLQMAGSIAAQSVSLSQLLPGANTDYQSIVGHLLITAGLAAAVSMGLHVKLAEGLIQTYDIFEVGRILAAGPLADWGIARIAAAFSMAFTLAMPFVISALVYNVALGVINRAMPQLMVTFIGAPALTAGGLILLALAVPAMIWLWTDALDAHLLQPI